MELSPQLLTTVAFREQWRGYSQPEVDEFLERVAVAVGELQQRLRDTSDRASEAERRLLERNDEDEIRRTLLLAQRTAAQVLEEARLEAERILADADAAAAERLEDAERRFHSQEVELAERERVELGALGARRSALQSDVDDLTSHLEQTRSALRDELGRLLRSLDDGPLAPKDPPRPSDVVVRLEDPPPPAPPAAEDVAPEEEEPAPFEADPEGSPWAPPTSGLFDDAASGEPTGGIDVVLDEPAGPDPSEPAAAELAVVDEPVLPDGGDPSPDGADGEEHDPFLAELRRAVTDTEPLGPRDHDPSEAIPVAETAVDGGGRFRLRRNRG